jgi:hypothetical protein
MAGRDSLPPGIRVEGYLSRFTPLDFAIGKFHALRKRYYLWRTRARDRRSPRGLRNFERKISSQYGEDGILAEIFGRIGEGGKYAVEFGIEDGSECCTRHLFEARGWAGLLIDGSPDDAAAARRLYAGRPVGVLDRFLRVENILPTFAEAGVPIEPDLLVIDVDGNDYWLWEKLLEVYRPRVVVVEYNGRWVPPRQWIMPYDPAHRWDSSVYFGASLESLVRLGTRHGYHLVACGLAGVNAFFVRANQLGDHFPDADRGSAYHYAAPLYGSGFGHPIRRRQGTGDRRQGTEVGGRSSRLGY